MPPERDWYVHLQGETLGPLTTDTVRLMLKQNRLQFMDFIWSEPLTKWHRIVDLDEFAAMLPQYPGVSIPSRAPSEKKHAEPEPEKKAAPKAKEKAKAKPEQPSVIVTASKPADAQKAWAKVRRHRRVSAQNVKVRIEGSGEFKVANVSEGGAFVEGKNGPAVGTETKLSLELGSLEKTLDMTGIVIRHGLDQASGSTGFAIQFVRVNPAHKRVLQEYVAQQDGAENSAES